MNAESAAFVPSASRGRKPLSNAAGSDSTINGQDTTPSSTHTNASSKIPRSTSAHNTPALGSAAGDANKFGHHSPTTTTTATGQSSSTSSHSRSASLPGHGGTSSSRGRGSSSSRGRVSTRGGRGGSRGGSHASSSSASHSSLPKKPSSPPSRPPVALDSVDEFPALGGGSLPISSSMTFSHQKESSSESTNENKDTLSPNLSKTSPTLSPSASMKGLSFARVVAPAPPSSSSNAPQQQSSSSSAQTVATSSAASSRSPSVSNPSSVSENTRATSPSTSMSPNVGEHDTSAAASTKGQNGQFQQQGATATGGSKKKKKRSSKDQAAAASSQGGQNASGQNLPIQQQQNAFNMYNGAMYPGAGGEGYERDPFNVVHPDQVERPYFEMDASGQPSQQQQAPGGSGVVIGRMQSPPQSQPGLTPVQIAFLAANGLSIEGMPNLPHDAAAGMSLEALQEYYAPLQLPEADHMQAPSGSSKGKKEGGKKGKKDRNQAGHPNHASSPNIGAGANGWNGTPPNAQGPYGSFDPQAAPQYPYYDPQYYDESQYAQYDGQQPQQPFDEQYQQQQEGNEQQPQLQRSNGSFHFHPDVPSFQPRHFSPDAQEFKPRSPVLHADAPVFVPPSELQQQPASSSAPSTETAEEEAKAPNGFVSAAADKTPKPVSNNLPPQEESAEQDLEQKEQESQAQEEAVQAENADSPSVVEQIQTKIEDTINEAKEAASDLISGGEPDAAAASSGELADEPSSEQAEDAPAKEAVVSEEKEDKPVEEEPEKPAEQEAAVEEEKQDEAIPAQAEDPQSPPHSTFSLLPPVTVEDVLDKAQSMADSVKETAQDAVGAVEETVQSVTETVSEAISSTQAEDEDTEASEQHTKDNLDELDIPNEQDSEAKEEEPPAGVSATQETLSNLDELDIPTEEDTQQEESEVLRHSKESSGTSASDSLVPDLSQHSLSPSEVEQQLTNATAAVANMPALQAEIDAVAQTSFPSSSTSPFEIISQSEDRCAVENKKAEVKETPLAEEAPQVEKARFEIISSSTDMCDVTVEGSSTTKVGSCSDIQIISTSEDRCSTEDETRGSRSATLDSLASTESAPFIRSSAPSPVPRQEELAPATISAKRDVPALSIPTHTPPVVISPSTPISPTSGSPVRPTTLTSPRPLSKTWQPQRPEPIRQASEAEKDEAIRLVRQLRSEPSTPLLESEDMLAATSTSNGGTTNASTIGESTESDTFKFDLSGRFSELSSSKRKRGKADDEEEEEDPDKKERKVDSGEAPSLTMSIFSGSILPRKQFIVSIFASLGINLFLPFVNGVMLGFGEIFARDWIGPLFGFGRNRSSSTSSNSSNKSFSGSGLGLRGAGSSQRGGAQDVPGHAAAKTAVETVAEEVAQAPSRL
ncbi:hypothetical protein P389DRAFT_169070 [Cystobasidium minutum MCA 4210]|uniref:uncharacterized protein n=1 Tax=Cystobasidium minutum MCA 4210 TaxID=1397322 RepID=UPI0034CE2358|eukprot:jgi/Rhomi1/169070/fgenesh1_kg.3_\